MCHDIARIEIGQNNNFKKKKERKKEKPSIKEVSQPKSKKKFIMQFWLSSILLLAVGFSLGTSSAIDNVTGADRVVDRTEISDLYVAFSTVQPEILLKFRIHEYEGNQKVRTSWCIQRVTGDDDGDDDVVSKKPIHLISVVNIYYLL